MTRTEAISRALFWAAFGVRAERAAPLAGGFVAFTSRLSTDPVVGAYPERVLIECGRVSGFDAARHEKTKLKALAYRALKMWAERNDAIEYFPEMRQMYRDELARLLGEPHANPALSGQE